MPAPAPSNTYAPGPPSNPHAQPTQRDAGRVQADTLPPQGDSFQDETRPVERLPTEMLLSGLEPPPAAQSGVWAAEHVSRSFTIPVAAVQGPAASMEGTTETKRVTYGIWGAAIGAILGIVLGVFNAMFEGVSIDAGIRPMFSYAVLLMIIVGAAAAYAPHVFDDMLVGIGIRDS